MRKPIPYSCPICGSRLPRAASRCFFCENPLPIHKGRVPASRGLSSRALGSQPSGTQELPPLYIAARDFGRLENLAHTAPGDDVGLRLLRSELDRAIVCDETDMPHRVVRMGSTVVLRDRGDDGTKQKLRGVLVYPGESHPSLPSISVLSPLGSAILGLSVGDSIRYEARNGVRHVAAVLSVVRPDLHDRPVSGDTSRAEGVRP